MQRPETVFEIGFNRTFMELKLLVEIKIIEQDMGLIVPLWN